MDCPCEENLIRMKLKGDRSVVRLEFNIAERTLDVIHSGEPLYLFEEIESLNLGVRMLESAEVKDDNFENDDVKQGRVLWWVLSINFVFFVLEISAGLFSQSMGLVADSLDMLADALVYGMSLMVVGAVVSRKKRVAKYSGILQILLACLGLSEVVRRCIGLEVMPDFYIMISVSVLALAANAWCLWLLYRTGSKDAHMKASVIFSANDVIINLGVILAGLLVWWFKSNLPDLIVGIIVFIVVIKGAVRILKLSK